MFYATRMDTFYRFLASPVGSALRVFVGTVLGFAVAHIQQGGTISVSDVWTWVGAAVAVAFPVVVAWLNPADPRFGR